MVQDSKTAVDTYMSVHCNGRQILMKIKTVLAKTTQQPSPKVTPTKSANMEIR